MTSKRGTDQAHGGNEQTIEAVIPLGTGAVSTQTKAVGIVPRNCRIFAIWFTGQAAVTATSLTAVCWARTQAGAAGTALNSATDIAFTSAAAAKAGVMATLTTTQAALRPERGLLIEVVITASGCSAGPGDLVATVTFEARE